MFHSQDPRKLSSASWCLSLNPRVNPEIDVTKATLLEIQELESQTVLCLFLVNPPKVRTNASYTNGYVDAERRNAGNASKHSTGCCDQTTTASSWWT